MKKLFTLLTLLLVSVGGATSAWGDPTYKDVDVTTVFIPTSDAVTAAKAAGWAEGFGTLVTNSAYTYDAGTDDIKSQASSPAATVKSGNGSKTFILYVTNVTEIKVWGYCTNGSAERDLKVTVTPSGESATTQTQTSTSSAVVNTDFTSLDKTKNYKIEVTGTKKNSSDGADMYVLAVKLVAAAPTTVPAAPTFSKATGTYDPGTEVTLSARTATAFKYQWTDTDVTLTTESAGWQDYSEKVAIPTSAGDHYLHAYAINAIGNSSVAKVKYTMESKTAVTLSFAEANVAATIGSAFASQVVSASPNVAAVADNIVYSISGDTDAAINSSTGVVTIGTVSGTATVTATFAGDEDYLAANASYTITISGSLSAVSEKFWNFNSGAAWGAITAGIGDKASKIIDNLEVVGTADLNTRASVIDGISFNKYLGVNTGASNAKYFHFKVAGKCKINVYYYSNGSKRKIKITEGSFDGTALLSTDELAGSTAGRVSAIYDTDAATDIYVFNSGGNSLYVYGIKVESSDPVSITPANNKSTYVATTDLDFSGVAGLKAYVATAATNGSVTLAEVGAVPTGTPLMLIGTAGTEYTVPVAASAAAIGTNLLRAGDGTTEFDGTTYDYILYTDGLFYQIGSGAVPVGKAYLHCDSNPTAGTPAPYLTIDFGGETTDISEKLTVNSEKFATTPVYNLAGQRVAQPTKGLYIVNGKKIVIK